jgi:uncharacterized protein YbjT (DUF2867 family)
MILVSGAPGNVGTELVHRLAARGEHVRVVLHRTHESPFADLTGVETVSGDLGDSASLAKVVDGADRVFVNSTVGPAILAQNSLIAVARQAGAERIVKLSWIGAAEDSIVRFARWHAQTEHHLKESGVPFTILRANAFMQNYTRLITQGSERTFHGAAGEGKASLVDARDVAAVAAIVLTESGYEGQTYDVTGSEALSNAEIASIVGQATGREIHYINLSRDEMAEGYDHAGLREAWADELVEADRLRQEGYLAAVSNVVATLTGSSPVTFAAFVRELSAPPAKHTLRRGQRPSN